MTKLSKEKAIELIDTGVGQGLATFFMNQVAVLVTKEDYDAQRPHLLRGLRAMFWAREEAIKAIERSAFDEASGSNVIE